MTTIVKLANCVADALEVPRRSVGQYVSSMKKADMLGAKVATADDAVYLLLGILASQGAKAAPDAIRRA